MDEKARQALEKQQYGMAGEHSAVKICTWTKKSLRDEDVCYKERFYGIRCHLCCQMSVSVGYCQNRCVFCWRDMEHTVGVEMGQRELDEPDKIIDNAIKAQRKLLTGFGGNDKVSKQKFDESQNPKHFAISLTGEALIYPKLSELIRKLHSRGFSTFVVSNGQLPEVLSSLEPPTQLYISVDAPNEQLFRQIDRPAFKDGWDRLMRSLDALKALKDKTRTAIRITVIKGMNMESPEEYAKLIKRADATFVEVKAYMFVGSSRQRLSIKNMPTHREVVEFSEKIAESCGYRIIDEKENSRVALLMKEDTPDRIMRF